MPGQWVEASKPIMCPLCGRLVPAEAVSSHAAGSMHPERSSRTMPSDSYFAIAMRVLPAMRRSRVAPAVPF